MGRLTLHREYQADGATVAYARTSVYDARSNLVSETADTLMDSGQTRHAVTTFDYLLESGTNVWAGGYQGGAVTHQRTVTTQPGETTITSDTETLYQWWDGARSLVIVHKPGTPSAATQYDTHHEYDANGHIARAIVDDGRDRIVAYVTDSAGQVMSRTETPTWAGAPTGAGANPRDQYFYFNGLRVGDLSNDGPSDTDYAATIAARNDAAPATYSPFRNGVLQNVADFDQSYDAITASSTRATGTRVTVQDGDTLSSIAQAQWGDASLWYKIADANGLSGSEPLAAGQILTLPAKVANVHNTSDTFRVYDPNKALGDTNPTQAKPVAVQGKKGCGGIGQILVVAIAVAVTVLSKGMLAKPMAALVGSVMGTGAAAALTAGTTSFLVASTATAVVAGAAGSIASQGFAVATGIQDQFSWKSVGISAISAGIGGGGSVSGGFVSRFVQGAIQSAGANALTQGIAVAVGLQDKFDWTGVAVGAVVGGSMSGVGGLKAMSKLPDLAQQVVTGVAGAVAGGGARSLIDGSDFGDNILRALPDVIGATIGNAVGSRLSMASSPQLAPDEKMSGTLWKNGKADDYSTMAKVTGNGVDGISLAKSMSKAKGIGDIDQAQQSDYGVLRTEDLTPEEQNNPQLLIDQGRRYDPVRDVWFRYVADPAQAGLEQGLAPKPQPGPKQISDVGYDDIINPSGSLDGGAPLRLPSQQEQYGYLIGALSAPTSYAESAASYSYNGMDYRPETMPVVPSAREPLNTWEQQQLRGVQQQEAFLGAPVGMFGLAGFAAGADADPNVISASGTGDAALLGMAGAAFGARSTVSRGARSPIGALTTPVTARPASTAASGYAVGEISTPYGPAIQSRSSEALAARSAVENGVTLYRLGTTGRSDAASAQFWALEHPLSPGYASRYGIPPANVSRFDFIETAVLRPGTPFVTRPAPGVGINSGGGIEVVVPANGVVLKYFGGH